jgi:hypothetical protein
MGVLATDNFDRANVDPIAGNWSTQTNEGSMAINTNHVVCADDQDRAINYNAITWPDDQYSQAAITASTGYAQDDGPGVGLRMSTSAETFYRIIMRTGTTNNVSIGKKVTGSFTRIAGRDITYAASTVLYGEVQGTTIIVKYGGVQAGASATDSSVTTGRTGLTFSSENASQTMTWDDWEGGDFAAVGLPPGLGPDVAMNTDQMSGSLAAMMR